MKFCRNKRVPTYITGKEELSTADIVKLLYESEAFTNKYQTNEDYYFGQHKILSRIFEDTSKPNNRVVVNYPKYIVSIRTGYFSSSPISFDSEDKDYLTDMLSLLDDNDFKKVFAELDTYSAIYGHAFLVMYLDEEGDVKLVPQKPMDWIFIRDNSLEAKPKFAIRYYAWWDDVENQQQYDIELYTNEEIINYEGGPTNLEEVGRRPHYFGALPVIEFCENDSKKGAFEDVIGLIDSYETILSDSTNLIEYFSDCYLVLTGCDADENDIAQMKQNRVIVLPENSDASFLMKNLNETYNKNTLKSLQEDIFTTACCPLLNDSSFGSNSSGVAIEYKLYSMQKSIQNKENDFRKGFNQMFTIIENILHIKGRDRRETKMIMTFIRSNPSNNLTEIADSISKLRGTVSNATLLSQLDFVTNVELEKERLRKEKEEDAQFQLKYNMALTEQSEGNEAVSDADRALEENKRSEDNNNYRE